MLTRVHAKYDLCVTAITSCVIVNVAVSNHSDARNVLYYNTKQMYNVSKQKHNKYFTLIT